MNGGGPPAADAFHTPSRQVDEELKALRDEVTLLRTELGSCKSELAAATSDRVWVANSDGGGRWLTGAAADATLEPAEPEPPTEAPARSGLPPFAWALLILGLFCNGLGGGQRRHLQPNPNP